MNELVPNDISPFVADVFLKEHLLAHAGLSALVDGRIAPAINDFEPSEFLGDEAKADEARHVEAWPYVLFGEDGDVQAQTYSTDLVMNVGTYLVRAFMREDIALSRGDQFENVCARIQRQLQNALQGTFTASVEGEWGGTVHECQLLPQKHRTTYGERGKRVCEMGVRVRISTT